MAAAFHLPPAPTPTTFRCHRRCLAVVRASSSSAVSFAPKARFVARRAESTSVQQLARLLVEYMSLPASQYSVLDAERIERVDDSTFRCYVYRFRFFALEVCPVLLVRVEEKPSGCCIRLLSCKLEGSPLLEAQNEKFSASMVNRVFCNNSLHDSTFQQLTSDASIEVTIDIPFPFRAIPVEVIESTGRQVLEQLLGVMLPRFLKQHINGEASLAVETSGGRPVVIDGVGDETLPTMLWSFVNTLVCTYGDGESLIYCLGWHLHGRNRAAPSALSSSSPLLKTTKLGLQVIRQGNHLAVAKYEAPLYIGLARDSFFLLDLVIGFRHMLKSCFQFIHLLLPGPQRKILCYRCGCVPALDVCRSNH